jgi:hypothetical protein
VRKWRHGRKPATAHWGCYLHPTQPSVAMCTKCENNVCEDCRLSVVDATYCLRCAMYTAGVSTRRPLIQP